MTSPREESPTGTSNGPASPKRVLVVFGTRPEAIKLCPLISALRTSTLTSSIETVVCVTAQHRRMLDQVLDAFEVSPEIDLDVMRPGQTLTSLSSRLLAELEPVLRSVAPSLVVVQGDTTSTLCGGLAAFYAGVPVAHVEAGLRTFDLHSPFPEEMNRVVVGRLAALHFAATDWAASNLLREGIAPERIRVTGNTGIDAVLTIRDRIEAGNLTPGPLPIDKSRRLVVVTAHRRESFGEAFLRICQAIASLADRPDVQIIWPVHPNPNVQHAVDTTLRGKSNIALIEPLDYLQFVHLMSRAYLLITDSGGVQEEGPSLGKPILVLREKTERPEAVEAGTVKLVGTDPAAILGEATRLLDDSSEYDRMSHLHNPYGDGKASPRIADSIFTFLTNTKASAASPD